MKALFGKVKLDRQMIIFAICALSLLGVMVAVIAWSTGAHTPTVETEPTITAEEIAEYRDKIGSDMDIKKAIILIFNTAEECQAFIDEHGADNDVLSLGKGLIPQMQEDESGKYYNVVGNGIFEPLFDSLSDGAYQKTPVDFGGAFCYFKRINTYSILEDDENLKGLILQEKKVGDLK